MSRLRAIKLSGQATGLCGLAKRKKILISTDSVGGTNLASGSTRQEDSPGN